MNISFIVLVGVVLSFIGAFVWIIFFKPKGRKVHLEIYEKYGQGKPVRLYADKKLFGLIYRIEGKESLKIPKRLSILPLQAPPTSCIIPTKSKYDILRLIKDAEGIFRPLEYVFDETDKYYKEKVNEQSEPIAWMLSENKALRERHKNESWMAKYGALVTLGIIVLGGLLSIYMTGQQINELNDDYRQQTLGEVTEQRSFMLDLVNNIKGDEAASVDAETDTENKPPGS